MSYLLSMHGKDLQNMDTASRSDPFVVVSTVVKGEKPVEIGRTETIDNDLEPHFYTSFPVDPDAHGEERLFLFDYFDRDHTCDELDKQDHLGSCKVPLANILNSNDMALKVELKQPKLAFPGYAILFLEPLVADRWEGRFCSFSFQFLDSGSVRKRHPYCASISRKATRFHKRLFRTQFLKFNDKSIVESHPIPMSWVMSNLEDPEMMVIVREFKEGFFKAPTFGTQAGYRSGTEELGGRFYMPYSALNGSGENWQSCEGSKEVRLENTGMETINGLTKISFVVKFGH